MPICSILIGALGNLSVDRIFLFRKLCYGSSIKGIPENKILRNQ
jgi:hypothetical protein